jgi:hypothetical protein
MWLQGAFMKNRLIVRGGLFFLVGSLWSYVFAGMSYQEHLAASGIEAQKKAAAVWGVFRIDSVVKANETRDSKCCFKDTGPVLFIPTVQEKIVMRCTVVSMGKNESPLSLKQGQQISVNAWKQTKGPANASYDKFGEMSFERPIPNEKVSLLLIFLPGDIKTSSGEYELVPSFGYEEQPSK